LPVIASLSKVFVRPSTEGFIISRTRSMIVSDRDSQGPPPNVNITF